VFKNKKGFTLLEIVISMGISSILILSTIRIVIHISNINNKNLVYSELIHQSTIAMEFLGTQINIANNIVINTNQDNRLVSMTMDTPISSGGTHIIRFGQSILTQNMLMFGNQEFARYIENMQIVYDKNTNLLYVTIITQNKISTNNIEVNPIILYRVFNAEGKIR